MPHLKILEKAILGSPVAAGYSRHTNFFYAGPQAGISNRLREIIIQQNLIQ